MTIAMLGETLSEQRIQDLTGKVRFATGISWYEAKLAIVRNAIRAYLAAPRFVLIPTA